MLSRWLVAHASAASQVQPRVTSQSIVRLVAHSIMDLGLSAVQRLSYVSFTSLFLPASFSPFFPLLLLLLLLVSFFLLSSLHCRRGTKTGDALCARDVNCSETGRREILGGNCVGFCWRMVPSYTRRDPFRKRGEAIFECGGLIEYFFFFLLKF